MKNDSEVFENYLKIIKAKDNKDPYAPKSVGKVKDITKLYYHGDDFIEYEKCLMEVAHPNKVIVTKTYDPINSLVENNIERQKIMLNIVSKPPTGQHSYQKYTESKNNLLLSLIKTANELDFENKDQLRILADYCIESVKKKSEIVKKANPYAWGVGAIAGLIGLLYAQQHLPKSSQGLHINYQNLVDEIKDIAEKSSWGNGAGVEYAGLKGVEYIEPFVDSVKELKDRVDKVYAECVKIEKIIAKLDKPRSASEAIEMAKQDSAKNIPIVFEMFKKLYEEQSSYFEDVVKKFSSEEYKLRQIKDKGFIDEAFSRLIGGKGIISDDFDDIRKALEAFQKSFESFLNTLKDAANLKQKASVDLQSASKTEEKSDKEEKPIEPVKQEKPSKPSAQKFRTSKEDQDLIKELNRF